MLRLIIHSGALSGRQFQVEPGDQSSLLIGRSEDCAVRFEDPVVSSRHAVIAASGEQFHLLDQQSANGTFLNGSRVNETQLRSGDLISLGTTGPQLRVVIENAATPELITPIESHKTQRMFPINTSSLLHKTGQTRVHPTMKWTVQETMHLVGFFDPHYDSGISAVHSLRATVLFVICTLLGLMVLGQTIVNLGLIETIGAGAISFISATIYLAVFLWLDRYDPEPFRTLAVAFVWGATAAIFIPLVLNDRMEPRWGELIVNVISAPLIEETSKAIGLLLIFLLFRRDFDSVVDGIVYAGVIALSFAAVENTQYYARSYTHGGVIELGSTYVLRGILAPFSHVLFTGMTGIGFGVARETHNRALKFAAPLIGFSFAVFFHSLWNWLASANLFVQGYFLLEVPLFFTFGGMIAYMVHREGLILKKSLAGEVERGLITQSQLDIAISVFRRTAWYLIAIGDRNRFRARRHFLCSVAKLGLCHWHKARASEANCDTDSFPMIAKLQAEVFSLRNQIS